MQLRLKVIRGKPLGHCLMFPIGEFMFGRGPECDIRPNSDLISRQHCLLQITEACALIRDLGSRNGTLVNGHLVKADIKLANGDTLQVGPLVLEVLMDPEPPAAHDSTCDTALVFRDETTVQEKPVSSADTCDHFKIAEPKPVPTK